MYSTVIFQSFTADSQNASASDLLCHLCLNCTDNTDILKCACAVHCVTQLEELLTDQKRKVLLHILLEITLTVLCFPTSA